jgi:hypothetical protein
VAYYSFLKNKCYHFSLYIFYKKFVYVGVCDELKKSCKYILGLKELRWLRNRGCNSNWSEKKQRWLPKRPEGWQKKKQPDRKNM